jgi:hypothetical protein
MADNEKKQTKLAEDQAQLAAFMRGVEGHIPIQTTKRRAVEGMARYQSARKLEPKSSNACTPDPSKNTAPI